MGRYFLQSLVYIFHGFQPLLIKVLLLRALLLALSIEVFSNLESRTCWPASAQDKVTFNACCIVGKFA